MATEPLRGCPPRFGPSRHDYTARLIATNGQNDPIHRSPATADVYPWGSLSSSSSAAAPGTGSTRRALHATIQHICHSRRFIVDRGSDAQDTAVAANDAPNAPASGERRGGEGVLRSRRPPARCHRKLCQLCHWAHGRSDRRIADLAVGRLRQSAMDTSRNGLPGRSGTFSPRVTPSR